MLRWRGGIYSSPPFSNRLHCCSFFFKITFVLLALGYWNFLTFPLYLSEGCVKNVMKLRHARGSYDVIFFGSLWNKRSNLDNFSTNFEYMCKMTYINQLNDRNITLLAWYLLNTSIGSKVYYYENVWGRLRRCTIQFLSTRKKHSSRQQKTHYFDW